MPATESDPLRTVVPGLALILNDTVPLPALLAGVIPVIQGSVEEAFHVQELTGTDAEFGVATTAMLPWPPACPNAVVCGVAL